MGKRQKAGRRQLMKFWNRERLAKEQHIRNEKALERFREVPYQLKYQRMTNPEIRREKQGC